MLLLTLLLLAGAQAGLFIGGRAHVQNVQVGEREGRKHLREKVGQMSSAILRYHFLLGGPS